MIGSPRHYRVRFSREFEKMGSETFFSNFIFSFGWLVDWVKRRIGYALRDYLSNVLHSGMTGLGLLYYASYRYHIYCTRDIDADTEYIVAFPYTIYSPCNDTVQHALDRSMTF